MLVAGLLAYEWREKGAIRLSFPSMTVLALMGFALYDLFTTYFYGAYHGLSSLSIRDLVGAVNANFCPAVILWYIQSHRIRVRLQSVAWAFSLVAVVMAIGFLYVLLVKHQMPHNPYRSIFGALTKKPVLYAPGQGNTNYLLFYRAEDSSLFGLVRFSYFFHGPESLAVVTSFLCLLAADLRQKTWQGLLFAVAFGLLLTSGTRSSWITLPIILLLRLFLTAGQHRGMWFVLALLAATSFTTLVIPPITQQILMVTGRTAQAASSFRADSTDTRSRIYSQTLERWLTSTDRQFFLGHVVPGESVMLEYAPAKIGTHSFYLGSLLYQKGIVGFCIFIVYWLSLLAWLYRTRHDRPWCIFLLWSQLSLLFSIMAFESTIMPMLLIGITLKIPARSEPKRLSGYLLRHHSLPIH